MNIWWVKVKRLLDTPFLINICTKYENDLSSGMKVTVWTWYALSHFSAKSQAYDLQDMGQDQKSLYITHLLLVVTNMKMIPPVEVNFM